MVSTPSGSRGAAVIALLTVALTVGVGAAVAAGAASGARELLGVPAPYVLVLAAFAINWVAFVPAFLRRTEHFYDLTGSLTYLVVVALSLVASARDPRAVVMGAMVAVWASRLGTFLFRRVRRVGKDGRFDAIKQSWARFLVAWTVQGLWVFVTACAAVAAMTVVQPAPLGVLDAVGAMVWAAGFGVEVVADRQKSAFKAERGGGFITTGLWAWSRHPNYFGEIVLWTGIAIMATPTLAGWRWVVWFSPVFVTLLLTRISGVPLLEARADERWGDDPEYQRYKARTPALLPSPPRRGRVDAR